MSVLVLAYLPGVTADGDRELAEALGYLDGSAEGCRFRVSGPDGDGGRRVVTLWESLDAFERWRDDRLAATLQSSGIPVPKFEVWPVDSRVGV
jgi:heme-degrading monooxygenase HmoA